MRKLSTKEKNSFETVGSKAAVVGGEISKLSEYFLVIDGLHASDKTFWYRGLHSFHYKLIPSALRYKELEKRDKAIALVDSFKRYAELRLPRIPKDDDNLRWTQIAQHYGIGTRLLDWTENAAVGLYFACKSEFDEHGIIYLLDPLELNDKVQPKKTTVFDAYRDYKIIDPYLKLSGKKNPRGKHTIAINPVWNSERISQQQGVFTLHGSRKFELDRSQATSLVKIPILSKNKANLLKELDRVGINEHSIFPEPEHLSNYLKWKNGL